MGLNEGHRQRLKKRFLNEGLRNFEDHNILELLLFYCVPRKDTNQLAHEVLNHFGGLSSVFDASFNELILVEGITENSAILLKMIPQLVAAYLDDQLANDMVLDTLEKTGKYLVPKFVGYTNEIFIVISLNSQKKIISFDIVHEGSVSKINIPIRKIVEVAIITKADSVILAHNHPGGVPIPSRDDITAAIEISNILRTIDVKVSDNIIVTGKEFVSIGDASRFFKDVDLKY